MALERERKFLLKKGEALPIEDMIYIKQGYIFADDKKQMRIRLIHLVINQNEDTISECVDAVLGYKVHINETDREEHESSIDIEMGQVLYDQCEWKVEKYRAKVDRWDVDLYRPKDNKSFVVAEIEYSDDDPFPKELPRWVGKEITGQETYSNIFIAKQKLW